MWQMTLESGGLIEIKLWHVPKHCKFASEGADAMLGVMTEYLLNKNSAPGSGLLSRAGMAPASMMQDVGIGIGFPLLKIWRLSSSSSSHALVKMATLPSKTNESILVHCKQGRLGRPL